MAAAIAAFLRFHDADTTYARWQRRWPGTIMHAGAQWSYVQFHAAGLLAGGAQEEAQFSVSAPATTMVLQTVECALDRGWLATIELWAGDPVASASAPDPNQVLLTAFTGQVTGGQDSLTLTTFSLGSTLAPVAQQVPPRVMSAQIMGVGAVFK